jgi:predicted nucleic acid-binding protein
MILVDTGPWVALFDPRDPAHERSRRTLRAIDEPLATTPAVLTEAFHLLGGWNRGTEALGEFIGRGGVQVWFPQGDAITKIFELMKRYADRPMDFADASLVCAAEHFRSSVVFTIDRNDFSTYRVRIGKASRAFRILE